VLCGSLILSTAKDFDKTTHRKERKVAQQEPLRSGMNKIKYSINNELRRTETNSGYSVFVRVGISSLLSLLFAPAHGRAPPAVHLRLSRAGG